MATRVLPALLVLAAPALAIAQPAPPKLTVGIFTPTVEFGTAQARLAYVQGLAKAIEQATGIKTEAQSYATLAALKKDAVDFAIIDGPCVASSYKVLASANIGGGTTRTWALYSSVGDAMQALKGKKLAFVAAGCSDNAFVDNAMLESEVDASFFSARLGEKDLTGAIASVTSYKTAQAVFAPVGAAKGLTKVFETGVVPNPAFVEVSGTVPAAISDKVSAAVVGYGGTGAIGSWSKPSREPYQAFAARLAPTKKTGVFANPEPVRIDSKDVLLEPPTLTDTATVSVRPHFVRQPGFRME
jgi:ABC-type nitrate/sulfonate/bicarbonate transport system substrate-binding protein